MVFVTGGLDRIAEADEDLCLFSALIIYTSADDAASHRRDGRHHLRLRFFSLRARW
ncbi:MAG: hypothetical protein AAF530_13485 [Pseudomonadota bacterium]